MTPIIPFIVITHILFILQPGFASKIEKEEEIQKTLHFKKLEGKKRIVVDNVFGSVKVTGYHGKEVQLLTIKTIKARSQEQYQEALREVTLDISEEDDLIELYVDGPFRCKEDPSRKQRQWRPKDYKVIYNIELKVPKEAFVELKTVNDGEIVVQSIFGNYDINNVNGSIEMWQIQGSGEVSAVNGDVTLYFQNNPKEKCRFGSINGEVRLYFQPKLSADFYLKTFNGEVFTDFTMTYLAPKVFKEDKKNGKTVYKVSHLCGVRAGKGGPEITLDGFNGDMFILMEQ